MNLTLLLCGAILISAVYADNKSSNKNEIDSKTSEEKTPPNLKKALIKAMDLMEKQASGEIAEEIETVTVRDEILDESTPAEQKPIVVFPTVETKEEPKEEQIEFLLLTSKKTNEEGDSENSDVVSYSVQVPRSISSKTENDIFAKDKKTDKDSFKKVVPTLPTTTTTTTTTKGPTHNSDGENIEVVEKQDIRILSAPLVTAFTVQQDLRGEPKKVIPLLNPSTIPPAPSVQSNILSSIQNVLPLELRQPAVAPQQQTFQNNGFFSQNHLQHQLQQRSNSFGVTRSQNLLANQQQSQLNSFESQNLQQNQFVPQAQSSSVSIQQSEARTVPLINQQPQHYNNVLLERQRLLEEQIRLLQAHARQQQEQILIQQQLIQDQHRKRFLEQNSQNTFQNLVQPTIDIGNKPQTQPKFEFNNEQQLPIKEAVNFRSNNLGFNNPLSQRTTVQIQPSNQLNFVPPSQQSFTPSFIPLELSKFQQLPQKGFQTFSTVPQLGTTIIPSISTSEHKQQGQQRTRVFRQESGTGNFGFNNFNSNHNFFRPSQAFQPVDNQIQNLLYQSGINPKSNEDFSIISKVLALNHGISPFTPQNFHYHGQFGSFRN